MPPKKRTKKIASHKKIPDQKMKKPTKKRTVSKKKSKQEESITAKTMQEDRDFALKELEVLETSMDSMSDDEDILFDTDAESTQKHKKSKKRTKNTLKKKKKRKKE